MAPTQTNGFEPLLVSIGIFAWNEAGVIDSTLRSLFAQTLFAELSRRNQHAEVLCVTNGCTDRTAEIAEGIFGEQRARHPAARHFTARVCNVVTRGKLNAWNQFVHLLSAPEARFLFMMDADIDIRLSGTLWNMLRALERNPEAQIATDLPRKDISLKAHPSWSERLSLAAARMTTSAQAQLCAQLYCIRAAAARNIFLPRDLSACEDGFIKALVCTDSLTRPVQPDRICVAPDAEHVFEAYTSPAAILRNQKRQVIGQTMVHLLVDRCLRELPVEHKRGLAATLRHRENEDPAWLKRLIAEHLRRTRFFWRLYPGLSSQRFARLAALPPLARLACFPSACAGTVATLLASFLAYRALKSGCTDYWPKAARGSGSPRVPARPPASEPSPLEV